MNTQLTHQPPAPIRWPGTEQTPDVYTIGGRAALFAYDLFKIWGGTNDRYFVDWVKLRIDKFGWIQGKQFVSYKTEGKRLGYILSLDTVLEMAWGEAKGKGEFVALTLTDFKKGLKKQRLSIRGRLSDFIPRKNPDQADAFPVAPGDYALRPSDETVGPETATALEPPAVSLEKRVAFLESAIRQLLIIQQQAAGQLSAVLIGLDPVDNHSPASVPNGSEGVESACQIDPIQPDSASVLSERINATDRPVEAVPNPAVPPLPPTPREHIRETVTAYCTATGKTHEEAYSTIYHQLSRKYGINVNSLDRQKNESLLEVCERAGYLTKVIAIVNSAEFQSVLATPQALVLESG